MQRVHYSYNGEVDEDAVHQEDLDEAHMSLLSDLRPN